MSGLSARPIEPVLAALAERFPGVDFAAAPLNPRGDAAQQQTCIRVAPKRLVEVMRFLHEDPRCRFEQLCDLTAVDYLDFPNATDRYAVVYSLLSVALGHRLWAKCFVNDPEPQVPTVTGIWHGAIWLEREVWDMFGVRFEGHPDLRRILTWEEFPAHPLRKDYPLRGQGEREAYARIGRDSA